jgi:class 3 adenylate cyclase/tetratricopeptide (TPR) repeat protein
MGGVAIVVFSDLVDSTALLARLGDDRMDIVRRAHIKDVTDAVALGDGRVIKTLGDGVMSTFESALGALRASAAIQAAVERLDVEHGGIGVAARVGVAAGEPIADGEDLHGMPVVIASRLSSAAETGEILIQDLVHALVASRDGITLGEAHEYELKGVPVPVRASALLWREFARDDGDDPTGRGEPGNALREPSDEAPSARRPRLPPPLAAYAEEPLIGRDREIAVLREGTASGTGRRAALVLGEPGIGKTRHAAAVAAEAHAGGAFVALARCPPDAVVPFEPWVRAIGELALAGDEESRRALARAAGREVAALVPELDEGLPSGEEANVGRLLAAESARYRLLRGIGAALGHASAGAPLFVVLDDAQWCDPASAQALGHLLESPPAAELSLVVTAREGEMGRGHPVSRALADLRRTGDLSELHLTGLDAEGVAALVAARVGRAIAPRVAAGLATRTSGNPFFAGELARDLDARGSLQDDQALDAAPVPYAVTGLVEERLAQLEPATEQLLTAAAVIGPSAPVALAAKSAGFDQETAGSAVRDALSERLVEYVASAEPTITFTHALVREALVAEVGDAARARLHLAVARALEEDPAAEPAELARHYGLCVELVGAEPALAALRAAATNAAEGHDHEAAAAHLGSLLSLLEESDLSARAAAQLELGEQKFLSGDLGQAREEFRRAVEASRATGDSETLARAALGFAGGDVGFGWEVGSDDPASVALLKEGLEALGNERPILSLRMIFRLAYLLIFTDDDATLNSLSSRAAELADLADDAEARVLAPFTALTVRFARRPNPLDFAALMEDTDVALKLVERAEECDREDLLFRVVQQSAWVHYTMGQIGECEEAIERGAEIAARLGSPRFAWEVEFNRAMRLFDRGSREQAEALARSAGAMASRLRPDIQIFAELSVRMYAIWIYDGDTEIPRQVFEAISQGLPRGVMRATVVSMQAHDGQLDAARHSLQSLLENDLEEVRRPDGHLPAAACLLADAAAVLGDREAGARLRPLFEAGRGLLAQAAPLVFGGSVPEFLIGRLELLAGRPDAAVAELRTAIARADQLEIVWISAWYRVELARALHENSQRDEALAVLCESETLAARHGVGLASGLASELRAEIEGRPLPTLRRSAGRAKPVRALGTRSGRRALAALARDLDDAALERRFGEPGRQRALMRALARGFQPAQAAGFSGTIAYELESSAADPPPESPWRWAIAVVPDSDRARLAEPAPLDADVTIHLRVADWVRVVAGIEDPLSLMVAGRCSVEGDVTVAARLEAIFGAR